MRDDDDLEALEFQAQADMERARMRSHLSEMAGTIKHERCQDGECASTPEGREKKLRHTTPGRVAMACVVALVVDFIAVKIGLDMGGDARVLAYGIASGLIAMFLMNSQLRIERGLAVMILVAIMAGCCGHEKAFDTLGTALNGPVGNRAQQAIDNDPELSQDRKDDELINLWLCCEVIEKAGGPPNTRKQPW